MIILNAAQAAHVRGNTAAGAALNPVVLANGTEHVLPEDVLDDPAHIQHRSYLLALPQRDILPNEWAIPAEA